MKHMKLFAVLAALCLLAGSAFAVSKLMPAVVDQKECLGCGKCVEKCPEGAITERRRARSCRRGEVHRVQEMYQSMSCGGNKRGVVHKKIPRDVQAFTL